MFQKQDSVRLPAHIALLALRSDAPPAVPVRLKGHAIPPGLKALFPGLDLRPGAGTSAPGVLALIESPEPVPSRQPFLRLAPGLLETPRFRSGLPWVSATVTGGRMPDGTPLLGAMQLACTALPAPPTLARARIAASRLAQQRLGGQAWADAPPGPLLAHSGPGLTVVVATSDEHASCTMLTHAVGQAGASFTLLLIPERSSLPMLRANAARLGCRIAEGPLDPWPILDAAVDLHLASPCAIGFLALLTTVRVHAHATLWHIGHNMPANDIVATSLTVGSTHADPFSGQPCSLDHALDLAAEWRRVCDSNRRVAVCIGMQFWKRRRIAQFLHTGIRPPAFRRRTANAIVAARNHGAIAAWASRMPADLAPRAAQAGIPVLRVEDGFLRSVGLGSDFNLPCSIVLDGSGLYYDPAQPSDLEHLLARSDFTPALLARARALIDRLVQAGLTKYNTGSASLPPIPHDGRRTILVTGQVANDLSVRLGGGAATDNADLLRRVRAANPGAYIVYKSHPDVDAGHRPGVIPDAETLRHADALARGAPIGALIGAVDELHTMTSLAGFEALLRGRDVVVWGRPFYAGWGLTHDMAAIPRRTRFLTLEQLAAGVLLLYPRYLDPVTCLPCPPEVLLDRLANPALFRPGLLVRARRLQGRLHAAIGRAGRPTQPERV